MELTGAGQEMGWDVDHGIADANGNGQSAFGDAQVTGTLVLELALAQTVNVFNERGIPSLLLKGAAFARWLYEDRMIRPYRDIDLLVPSAARSDAARALRDLGFEPVPTGTHWHETAHHHEIWARPGPVPIPIELHHTLFDIPAAPELVWARMSERSRTIELAGVRVAIPSDAASAFLVAIHCVRHGAEDTRHLRDLQHAVERIDFSTWEAATALARDLGVPEAFAAGLRLVPPGQDLADRLGLSYSTTRRVRLYAGRPPDTSAGIEALVTTPGLRGKLELIVQELIPSRTYMRFCYPLARRGTLGLFLAHLWRPVALAVKLPRGITAWARAARSPAPPPRIPSDELRSSTVRRFGTSPTPHWRRIEPQDVLRRP